MDYNIAFVTDDNYLQHVSVTLISLLENNPDINFTIYILGDSFSDEKYNSIALMVKPFACKLKRIVVDDSAVNNLVLTHHFSKAAYYKLFIPQFVPDDKILFLDADIVINGSIMDVYNTDISNSYLGAVEVPYFGQQKDLKMDSQSKGFNSGVMLINLKKWREEDISHKVIDFVQENPGVIKYVDNCGLNAIVNGNFVALSPIYNYTEEILVLEAQDHPAFSKKEIIEAQNNPVIIHYTGTVKPWEYLCKHPYKDLYWHYLKKTPFKKFRPLDYSIKTLIEKNIPEILYKPVKKLYRIFKN